MSEFDQNIPDDLWRKAFEEAAETPAPRVWDAIERRLDEEDGTKVLPLWGSGLASSRPAAWGFGIAAAVALLLVGWWVRQTALPEKTVVYNQPVKQAEQRSVAILSRPVSPLAPAHSLKQGDPVASINPIASRSKSTATNCWPSRKSLPKRLAPSAQQQLSEAVAKNQRSVVPANSSTEPTVLSSPAGAMTQLPVRPVAESPVPSTSSVAAVMPELAQQQRIVDTHLDQTAHQTLVRSAFRNDSPIRSRLTFAGTTSAMTVSAPTQQPLAEALSVSVASLQNSQAPSFGLLQARTVQLGHPGAIQRIVWFRPAEPALEPATTAQPKRAGREVWASLSLMPGAFNPSVAVRSALSSYVNATSLSNTSTSQPSVNSLANFSVAYQAGAGIQLSERWSVESGVGYLAGRSTVESPVQASVRSLQAAMPDRSGQMANLYVDALRTTLVNTSSATANSIASFDYAGTNSRYTVQNNYNPQERQSLANNYQFVQVPVQVGYQLRPRKRLSLALIGGFLSNIFVRNTVGDELVITSRDGVYRPVSWAATMGARVRYRPSRQWSASLAGLYQPSLGAGTRPGSAVQMRPTSTGMSFGIDYHF